MDYSEGSTPHQKRGLVDSLRLQQRQINEVKQKFAKIMNDSKCRSKKPAAWSTERGALVDLSGNHAAKFTNRSPGCVPRDHKKSFSIGRSGIARYSVSTTFTKEHGYVGYSKSTARHS